MCPQSNRKCPRTSYYSDVRGHYDTETGTIYLRARYYHPVTGRFISRDSYTDEHGDPLSINLYTFESA
ncbi:MAG: hypothetical protein PUC41_02970 [Oscillospiraceae bacterium]|nr:hypothetical protein [Oscillospiraceae bacterium]